MNANEYLDEVEKRAEAATSGPWEFIEDRRLDGLEVFRLGSMSEGADICSIPKYGAVMDALVDAEFIAASRTDVPRMAKALRAVLKVTNMHQARMTMGEIDPGNTSFSDGHQIGWLKGEANMSEKVRRAITEALEGEE